MFWHSHFLILVGVVEYQYTFTPVYQYTCCCSFCSNCSVTNNPDGDSPPSMCNSGIKKLWKQVWATSPTVSHQMEPLVIRVGHTSGRCQEVFKIYECLFQHWIKKLNKRLQGRSTRSLGPEHKLVSVKQVVQTTWNILISFILMYSDCNPIKLAPLPLKELH